MPKVPRAARNIFYFARYSLSTSLAAACLTFSIVAARADNSPPLPSPAPLTAEQTIDQCRQQYSTLRQDLEAKAQPIRDVRDTSHGRAYTGCKLITIYEEAELRLISFIEANSKKCGISNEISEKMRIQHVTTEKLKGEVCRKAPGWQE